MTESDQTAEPADGTALYWPETSYDWPRLVIRDDMAATALGNPEAHWFAPNGDYLPLTWAEFCDVMQRSSDARRHYETARRLIPAEVNTDA